MGKDMREGSAIKVTARFSVMDSTEIKVETVFDDIAYEYRLANTLEKFAETARKMMKQTKTASTWIEITAFDRKNKKWVNTHNEIWVGRNGNEYTVSEVVRSGQNSILYASLEKGILDMVERNIELANSLNNRVDNEKEVM